MDVFEDFSDDEAPGPGQYYNPNTQTCFKKAIAEPRLQKFGSSVDRFQDPFEAKQVQQAANLGPGSYNLVPGIGGIVSKQRSLHQLVYSGFTSSETRFNDLMKSVTPGPGEYTGAIVSTDTEAPPKHKEMFSKMAGRFGRRDPKEQIPGPGQYNQNMLTMGESMDARTKKARAIQEQVKRSSSMFLAKQKMMSVGPSSNENDD